jgi:hypothetical protein
LSGKHPAGPGGRKRLADSRGADLGASPQARDAAQNLGWRGSAAQQEQASREDRREAGIGRTDGDFQRLEGLGPFTQGENTGRDSIIRPVRQRCVA